MVSWPTNSPPPQNKKQRHRHSPAQLAALNDLFDKNEHPPLDLRTALADRLGMETKTVNAWFQNKRASSKKRTRTLPQKSPINASSAPTPGAIQHSLSRHSDLDDYNDDDYYSHNHQLLSRSTSLVPPDVPPTNPSLHHDHFTPPDSSDSSNMPICRKLRIRPSQDQTDELRRLYNINPHPTSDERQALSERIGMRYQSITNWFQNQRSLAKKRREDDILDPLSSSTSKSDYQPSHNHHELRQYSAFPPPPPHSLHPSLLARSHTPALPPPHPPVQLHYVPSSSSSRPRRSPSVSSSLDEHRSSSRRSSTPYSNALLARPRRSRPEPYQLDALKGLFMRTSTPTIEERSALALEIGMDVGKVTNWFRNLRQTARKRKRKSKKRNGGDKHAGEGEVSGDDDDDDEDLDHDDDMPSYSGSGSLSRDRTPSLSTRSSSSGSSSMELYEHRVRRDEVLHSYDIASEDDDYQEALTPPSGHSPSPELPGLRRRSYSQGHEDPRSRGHTRGQPYSTKPPRELAPAMIGVREHSAAADHERATYQHRQEQQYPDHRLYASYDHHHHHHPGYNTKVLHGATSAADIALGRFSATVAIYDEDPRFSAETAKKFGIDIEDAYLLLGFQRG